MELKQKLSDLRRRKGLTQLELAEMLSVSRQAVSRWEVGTAVPSLDNLVSLSKVYGIPLDELVHGGIDQPDSRKNEPAVSVGGGQKRTARFRTLGLALCLIAVGALIATAAYKLYRDYHVRKILERAVMTEVDGIHILTDNPEKFQHNPEEPRSYRMNPDGTFEEYSWTNELPSLLAPNK